MYFLCGFFFRQVKILHSFSFFCWQATLKALSSPICYFYALWRLIECIFILAHCSKIWRNEIRNVVYLVLGSNPLACAHVDLWTIFPFLVHSDTSTNILCVCDFGHMISKLYHIAFVPDRVWMPKKLTKHICIYV